MNWRIEENRWISEKDYHYYASDKKHQITILQTDESMGNVCYYVNIVYYQEHTYEQLVSCLIRERYDLNSELALLRQRDTKPEDFATYNQFAEDCKVKAQTMIKEREDFYASLAEPTPIPVDPTA